MTAPRPMTKDFPVIAHGAFEPPELPPDHVRYVNGRPVRDRTTYMPSVSMAVPQALRERRTDAGYGAKLSVDFANLHSNMALARQRLGEHADIGAVVKADGYGLGAPRMVAELVKTGVSKFFVARAEEAIPLRQELRQTMGREQADKIEIFVLDGVLPDSDTSLLVEHRITPVLNSLEQVKAWNKTGHRLGMTLPAILQFDTGMSRAGIDPGQINALVPERSPDFVHTDPRGYATKYLSHLDVKYVMTHLFNAGDAGPPPQGQLDATREAGQDTRKQLSRFEPICAKFPLAKPSFGASSTVFLGQEYREGMVRMGATFHGQAPFDAATNPLRPLTTLQTKLGPVRTMPRGSRVGYGGTYTATAPTPTATIPIGYADGIPRAANGNRSGDPQDRPYVLVDGKYRAPVIGAVSMDMMSIDLSDVPPPLRKEGVSVIVVGQGLEGGGEITPDDLGAMYGTNASEAQTKLSRRILFEYVNNDLPRFRGGPSVNQWVAPGMRGRPGTPNEGAGAAPFGEDMRSDELGAWLASGGQI